MDLFQAFFFIHVICGGASLLLGLIIMFAGKGTKRHKFLGYIYYCSMLTAALVSLPMSCLHPNLFLFTIGIFTSYMLITGKRYLKKKDHRNAQTIDVAITSAMLLFGCVFVFLGGYQLVRGNLFGIVMLVFGMISILFVYQDYVNYKGKSGVKNFWLTTHLQRMTGSYIASATAFLVVNNTILPGVVAWLLPTALLVPLIIKWSRRHELKMNRPN
jgi:uncharacterized membrane protein